MGPPGGQSCGRDSPAEPKVFFKFCDYGFLVLRLERQGRRRQRSVEVAKGEMRPYGALP